MKYDVGDRVLWCGNEYTVWSLHEKSGWRWIVRDDRPAIPAKMSSLSLVSPAPVRSGLERKETGMAQALEPDRITEWKHGFRTYVESTVAGTRFTSEDVVAVNGLPSGAVGKDANNAVGAMMNGMAKRGLIRKTGLRVNSRRSTSHGAELIVWERTGS